MSEFRSTNPANGETVWKGSSSSVDDVNHAVNAARKAFPAWSNKSWDERIEYLLLYKAELEKQRDEFALTISKEMGKLLWESTQEVGAMIGKIDISIEAQKDRCKSLEKEIGPIHSITRHRPHGVAAILGPYNFPGHLPNGHIVPALLAGNTVVFKPSELTPGVGQLLYDIWHQIGLPEGVLNLVQGGAETGIALSQHEGINALFFTGSWGTGQKLIEWYAKHPDKMLALEMGGNNPLVISDVADKVAAAYQTIQSAFITSGQRCTCARRLILVGEQESFMQELLDQVHQISVGPYDQSPEPFMGPLVSEQSADHVLQSQDQLLALGANPILASHKEGKAIVTPGILDVTGIEGIPDREIFGPVLQVIRVSTFEDALVEANRTAYGLSAGLLSDHQKEYTLFTQSIRAGIVNWNTALTGASSAAPFGGVGQSGNFRPSAYYAADYCCYPVASMEAKKVSVPEKKAPGLGEKVK